MYVYDHSVPDCLPNHFGASVALVIRPELILVFFNTPTIQRSRVELFHNVMCI